MVTPDSAGALVNQRIQSIDAIRALAILAVVAIHCDPFTDNSLGVRWTALGGLIDLLSRFAVPFFFVAAGYFLGVKARSGQLPLHSAMAFASRLLAVIAFWYSFYIFWPENWRTIVDHGFVRVAYWNATHLFDSTTRLLNGPRIHLWFLSALLIGGLHVALAQRLLRPGFLLFYALVLYALGLMNGAYIAIPGVAEINPGLVGRIAFPPLMIVLGWNLATRSVLITPFVATALFVTGTAIFICEAWFLHEAYGVPFSGHDFLLGTPFQAVGLLSLAVVYPKWGARTPLPSWGRYTLGVYAAHVAVMEALGAHAPGNLAWESIKTLLVYAVTLLVVIWFARVPLLRRFLV